MLNQLTSTVALLQDSVQEGEKRASERYHTLDQRVQTLSTLQAVYTITRHNLNVGWNELHRIVKATERASRGKLSPALLRPHELLSTLHDIDARLPAGVIFVVPVNKENVAALYNSAHVQTVPILNGVRFFINFPLKQIERAFTVRRVLKWPQKPSNDSPAVYMQPDTQ
jgi:hypothetical protein